MSEIRENFDPRNWGVYVVTDESICRGRTHLQIAEESLIGGADAVQLRDKEKEPGSLLNTARELLRAVNRYFSPLIINDHVRLAMDTPAHGVHLGTEDLSYSAVKEILPEGMILGASAGNEKEIEDAILGKSDYIGLGPIFEARETKRDAGEPVGLGFIEKARAMTELPLIAIGGIDHEKAASVIAAGASGIAVISAVVSSENMEESTRRLKEIVESAKSRYC